MTSIDAANGPHSIDEDECRQLLAGEVVGRLAVVHGHTPAIFPVNFVMDGTDIVFRTDPGTKLDAAERADACFEIDGIDREHRLGWSVVATGRLEEVTQYDSRTWRRVQALPVEPWAGGAKSHWMRLVPELLTGRRVGPPR
jgi:nitroimidazol reductase NimA-like FMN-containing flavoprotein (pyridoxamine 5'-phosphate oxidase superfamily)